MASTHDRAQAYFDRLGGDSPSSRRRRLYYDDTSEWWWEREQREERERAGSSGGRIADRFARLELEARPKEEQDLERARRQEEGIGRQAEVAGVEGPGGFVGFLGTLGRGLDATRALGFAAGEELGSALTPGGDGFELENLKSNFNDRKGFGDTSVLRMDEDDSLLERSGKGLAAFLGDVATDPLTYLTFGAGAMGRQAASAGSRAGARAAVRDVTSELSESVLRRGARGNADAVARHGERFGMGRADDLVARFADEPNRVLDELSEKVSRSVRRQGLGDDVAEAASRQMFERLGGEGLSNGIMEAYAVGGGRGASRYLGSLGEEAQELLFKKLPPDLRGGLRLASPVGPASWRRGVRLLDGSKVSDALDEVTGGLFGQALGAGGAARMNVTRRFAGSKLGELSGQSGAAYRVAVSAAARRSEDVTGLGWGRWANSREIVDRTGIETRALNMDVQHSLGAALNFVKRTPQAQRGAAESALKVAWLDPRLLDQPDEVARRLGLETLTEAEQAGVEAARSLHDAIGRVGDELKRVYGDDVGHIENFVPRMMTELERVYRDMTRARKGGAGASGGKYNPRRAREAYVEAWKLRPDGRVDPDRWMNPEAIARLEGRAVFEDDPFLATSAYLSAATSTLKQERILRQLDAAGLLRLPGVVTERGFNNARVPDQIRRALGAVDDKQQSVRKADEAEGLNAALRESGVSDPAARQAVRDRAEQLKGVVEQVKESKGGKGDVWRASFPGRQTRRFTSHAQAQQHVNRLAVQAQRDEAFTLLQVEKEATLGRLMGDHTALAQALNEGPDWGDPVAAGRFIDDLLEVATRHVDDLGRADFESAAPVRGYIAWFKDPDNGFVQLKDGVQGTPFVDGTVRAGTVNAGYEQALQDMFAAPEVARLVKDTAELRMSTGGDFRRQVMDPYMRFFKTWATVGRGPGFVARNVLGGMLNAYLLGARAVHFERAGDMLLRHHLAERRIRRQMADEARAAGYTGRASDMPIDPNQLHLRTEALFRSKVGDAKADLWDRFQQHGLDGGKAWQNALATSGYSDDFARSLSRGVVPSPGEMSARSRLGSALTDNWWIRKNGAMASGSESYLRLGSFLAGAERYGVQDGGFAAAQHVKVSQFDYDLDSMTLTERKWARFLMPFYTFSRWNAPLNVRAVFSDPSRVMQQFRAFEQAQRVLGSDGHPDDDLPEWMQELGGDRLGFSASELPVIGNIWGLNNDLDPLVLSMSGLPVAELGRFTHGEGLSPQGVASGLLSGESLSAGNPAMKAAAEQVFGRTLFTGSELKDRTSPIYEGPAQLLDALTGNQLDVHGQLDGEEFMRAGWANAVHNLLPMVGLADRVLAPGDDPRHDRRTGSSLISTVTGLGLATADPTQLVGASYGRQNEVERRIREAVPNFDELGPIWTELLNLGYRPEVIREMLERLGPEEFARRLG